MPGAGVRYATVGGLDIAFQTMGEPSNHPVLLVAGLGMQLIGFDDGFCDELVARGLFVIRFDNRDVGLSTHLVDEPPEAVSLAVDTPPVYGLADMANDAVGLLDGLGLGSAHVVGASMGGMIAQIMAIEHPVRVRSLTSLMSTTSGQAWIAHASEAAMSVLMLPPVSTRDEAMDRAVMFHRAVGSPGYPTDDSDVRAKAARAFDRAFDPAGVQRQLQAVMATPDRTEALRRTDRPTLVIHGAQDPLIVVEQARQTAEAIPDADLLVIEGMGHDVPPPLWSTIAERIGELIARTEQHTASVAERWVGRTRRRVGSRCGH